MKGKRNNFTILWKFAYFYIYCCHALERVVCVIFFISYLAWCKLAGFSNSSSAQEDTVTFLQATKGTC